MTVWWWVRHAPTHENAFAGWRDVPADITNTARIARLNAALPKDALLVSSDLRRAIQTRRRDFRRAHPPARCP